MPLSPTENRPGAELNQYLASWNAIEKLVHRGHSWSGHERKCAYLNTHGARFANVSAVTGFDFDDDGRALAVVDWDLDGDLDVWMANRTGPRLRLLRNDSDAAATGNRFVAFKLQGVTCNRDAIGARVEVQVRKQPKLVQTLCAGDAYLSQSSKWVHFGLGSGPEIERVVVRWPGGGTESFSGIAPNRRYTLTQGSSQAVEWIVPSRKLALASSEQTPPPTTDTARVFLSDAVPMPSPGFASYDGGTNFPAGPLLINLWASWCAPCVAELREFTASEKILRASGLEILAASVDGLAGATTTAADARRVLTQTKFPFATAGVSAEWLEKMEILFDRLFDRHLEFAVPMNLLVDRDGKLSAIYRGRVSVETLVQDVSRLDAPRARRRELAVPFAGRWYSQPGQLALEQFAADYGERFPDEAVRFLKMAMLGSPASASTNGASEDITRSLSLALLQFRQGKVQQATEEVLTALKREPENVEGMVFLAELLRIQGQPDKTIELYRHALRLKPDQPDVANRLARLLATHPDARLRNGEEAVRFAKLACEGTGARSPEMLDTLSAAYAESGRFDEAVSTMRRALALIGPGGDGKKIEAMNARLDLYVKRRPFHEPARGEK